MLVPRRVGSVAMRRRAPQGSCPCWRRVPRKTSPAAQPAPRAWWAARPAPVRTCLLDAPAERGARDGMHATGGTWRRGGGPGPCFYTFTAIVHSARYAKAELLGARPAEPCGEQLSLCVLCAMESLAGVGEGLPGAPRAPRPSAPACTGAACRRGRPGMPPCPSVRSPDRPAAAKKTNRVRGGAQCSPHAPRA